MASETVSLTGAPDAERALLRIQQLAVAARDAQGELSASDETDDDGRRLAKEFAVDAMLETIFNEATGLLGEIDRARTARAASPTCSL